MGLFSQLVTETLRESPMPMAVGTTPRGDGFLGYYEIYIQGEGPKRIYVAQIFDDRETALRKAKLSAALFQQMN